MKKTLGARLAPINTLKMLRSRKLAAVDEPELPQRARLTPEARLVPQNQLRIPS
jgi:hypothetical protein